MLAQEPTEKRSFDHPETNLLPAAKTSKLKNMESEKSIEIRKMPEQTVTKR